jgi:hypothetical protein
VAVEWCPYGCGWRDLPEFLDAHIEEDHTRDRQEMSFNEWREFYRSVMGLDDREAEDMAERRIVEQENRARLRAKGVT